MAEAHSAVAFSFSITHEGWDVNFDREVLHLVWQSGIRSWKKRLARFQNSIHNGLYPGHLWSLWVLISVTSAVHFSGYKVPYDLVNSIMPYLPGDTTSWQLTGCTVVTFALWLVGVFTLRYSLKLLLIYKGWMYEERGRGRQISTATKLWVLLVRVLSGWNKPKLYSFQGSLPRLPLPSLHCTMQRYLRSVRPLVDETNYDRMVKLADAFESGIGVKLQRYLLLKSWWSSNYVSDWWEEYVYLRGRSPLMVNSNFYGMDAILTQPTDIQAARAASVIHTCLHYRRLLERQELEPIMVQGLVPLCSSQYERVFNTTRVPGAETDKIVHYDDSNHVVVYYKGRYFKVIIYKGRLLKPSEIQIQIETILRDTSEPSVGEEHLAALTAGERTHWALTRQQFFSKGVNKQSLDAIEKAAFVVALDDVPFVFDKAHPEKLDMFGKTLLHGKGYDRWFDKSFTLCIGSNGRIGFNAEHSWADAAVLSHLWELVIIDEDDKNRADAPVLGHLWEIVIAEDLTDRYDEKGNINGIAELVPPTPIRLQWKIDADCQNAIEKSMQVVRGIIEDVDLRIYLHDNYGKGFMKQCRVSPDAYIQMALQLAYYRDAGKFSLTYEASMTRLFREGRTETVRPCTIESSAWVIAMNDMNTSTEERIDLLQTACKQHQVGYQDAMCGKGIDRHLFCLYVVSKYLEVDSPFLKEVLSEPWRLSTSQTPHGQTNKLDLSVHPNCISAGGGFGPVADDGYGVSYIIAGENTLFFHISNKLSSKQTNCNRFAKQIERALTDIRNLFIEYKQLNARSKPPQSSGVGICRYLTPNCTTVVLVVGNGLAGEQSSCVNWILVYGPNIIGN